MLENIYKEQVTILNKLRYGDSDEKRDVWYKTVVDNVVWYTDSARSAGSHDVFIGSYITILFPFNEKYLPYMEWKDRYDRENYFTASNGDYVVKGIVTEEITPDNITKVMQKYREDVCIVRHHNDKHNRFGARVQLKIQGV